MGGASSPPPPAGLAGIAGADAELPAGAISRGDDLAALAAVAPARSVHQAISCRPEDVRKPSRGNSVHRGFTPGADGSMHHGGSHHSYMALKIQKLGEQNEAARASGAGGVFAGVSIYVNGITDPPWIDLKDIMLSNGGRFQNYYSRATVTHIVCAHLTMQKLEALAKADRHHPPVVRPEWVVDSLRQGKLMPCARYALQGTLEPGQRRVTAVLAPVPAAKTRGKRIDDDDDDDDDDDARTGAGASSPTSSAPSSDPGTEEIAPTQEDLEDTGAMRIVATRTVADIEAAAAAVAAAADVEVDVEPGPDARAWATRVVFETTRARLETTTTSTVGRDSRRFASEEAIRVAAASSAAAYGALAAVVDPARVVPVSAWEALVKDPNEDPNEDPNVDENLVDPAAIAGALVAAGVDATATRVRLALPVDGVARVVVPTPEPRDPAATTNKTNKTTTTTTPPGANKTTTSALKSAARTRGSLGSSSKRKRVRWSEGVEDGEPPAGADDRERDGGTGAATATATATGAGFGPGRRSSFAAAAARAASAGVRVDDATWAELPLDVRAELMGAGGKPARGGGGGGVGAGTRGGTRAGGILAFASAAIDGAPGTNTGTGTNPANGRVAERRRSRSPPPDPTMGESEAPNPGLGPGPGSAASAFARHLGMRRERDGECDGDVEVDEGRSRRACDTAGVVPRAGPEPDPDPEPDAGFPSTYSQIDPDVLEAIGEDERRRLRAHYDEEAARRSREATTTRRGVVVRKTANARARGRAGAAAAEANRLARMFSAKPDRDEAPARPRARVPVPDAETHANLDHIDHHLDEEDDEDGGENHRTLPATYARDAPASPSPPGLRVCREAATTVAIEDDDAVDGLVAALETCVESLAGNDADASADASADADADADAAALGAAADLLEDQGVAFAEAHMLEWTARLMRRGKSLATRHPERWRVHFERAWRGVAAAVAREYDGATLSLDEGDGNRAPRGKGKITIGPKVGAT